MYVIVNKITQKSYVFKYAVDVIKLTSCNKNTITNNKHSLYWSYKDWIIYNPVKVILVGKKRGNPNKLL
jgi:hypothetical protein